jgi:hypothetical protein
MLDRQIFLFSMSNLNRDILYLIFEELKDDGNSLYSCLLVNKIWTNIIIPILWKNPWKYLKKESKNIILLKVIISHLSDEIRNNLKEQSKFQKPIFNYISFCKYLDFKVIINLINSIFNIRDKYMNEISDKYMNEIIKLFINENMRFTHLYIPNQFNYKIYDIPGFEYCFSGLEFLRCDLDNIDNQILEGLTRISKTIKNLEFGSSNNNTEMSGIIKLIEVQKKLNNVYYLTYQRNETLCKSLEESLIKHVDTIKYLKINGEPITKILLYFNNLISLEMDDSICNTSWKHLENVILPNLKFLKAKRIPSKYLAKLIENTNGKLNEISINLLRYYDTNYKVLIQAISQNCPKLQYLMLMFKNRDIIELEKLLINCQNLNGLIIVANKFDIEFDWSKLFEILTKSSPICLFKFKFYFYRYRTLSRLDSLNLLFDNWKGRHPMLLQTVPMYSHINLEKYFNLIEKYKEEGIVKKYENVLYGNTYDEFEWIKKRF